jgi:hypothetical protein
MYFLRNEMERPQSGVIPSSPPLSFQLEPKPQSGYELEITPEEYAAAQSMRAVYPLRELSVRTDPMRQPLVRAAAAARRPPPASPPPAPSTTTAETVTTTITPPDPESTAPDGGSASSQE